MAAHREPERRLPLPQPAAIHSYIGHLLRELRIARRLLRLTQDAEDMRAGTPTSRPAATTCRPEAAHAG